MSEAGRKLDSEESGHYGQPCEGMRRDIEGVETQVGRVAARAVRLTGTKYRTTAEVDQGNDKETQNMAYLASKY